MKLIDGKARAKELIQSLKTEIENYHLSPTLAILTIGNDAASQSYVSTKKRVAKDLGVTVNHFTLDENVQQIDVENVINVLNADPLIDGMILQLPIPDHLDVERLTNLIDVSKDVDGFTGENLGKLMLNNDEAFVSCTPAGILDLLDWSNTPVVGKKVTILGRSNIVGKPLAMALINRGATVTVCNSHTDYATRLQSTLHADIVIVAVGQPNLLKAEEINDKATIIDVGINRLDSGKLVGDVDASSFNDTTFNGQLTPVPGGVGPMTVAHLMSNVIKSAKARRK